MSGGAYLVGMVEVLGFVSALLFSAYRVRVRLLPAWSGSPARLAEAILALSLTVCVAELLGVVGLLHEIPLLLAALALALCCRRLRPAASGEPGAPDRPGCFPSRTGAIAIALAASLGVLVSWLPATVESLEQGIDGFDSMWYHLPAAARFAETGSITSLHLYVPIEPWWFLPANTELVHALGIALLDRDALSPLLNLGWLGLALLGAWCIGRPYGVQAISLVAVAAVLVSPGLVVSQAGRAKPDIASIALILAAAAILLNATRQSDRAGGGRFPASAAAIVVAGLAGGLAVGARPNAIPVVGLIGLGLVALAPRGGRRLTALAWFGPVLLTGGFWYLRNLFATGNPLPLVGVEIGPLSLPETERAVDLLSPRSIADVIADGSQGAWHDYFRPGLEFGFGELWFFAIGLALAGMIGAAAVRETPIRGVLGAAALLGTIVYVFTPYTGSGPGDAPTLFSLTLRYVIPVLALGLALLPTLPVLRSPPWLYAVGALALLAAVLVFDTTRLVDDPRRDTALLVCAALALIVAGALVLPRLLSRPELAICGGIAVILAATVYWPVARDYLRDRYADVWPGLYVSASFSWANDVSDARIALSGTTGGYLQYGYYGRDVSNTVEYVGHRGPRGAFAPIETCAEWRQAVNRGAFDYLVTTPTLNPSDIQAPGYSPEREWLGADPAAVLLLEDGPTAVFELTGPLDPEGCARIKPLFSGLPPLLR